MSGRSNFTYYFYFGLTELGLERLRSSVEPCYSLLMAGAKEGVFISHIIPEKPIALKLQEYIRKAFGPEFSVFVSSDQTSVGGGRKWFQHIITNLNRAQVVLVLVSQESAHREWINFEAGLGEGTGACVIPVAIKAFTFDKLRFPLAGFNGRYVDDIEGIVLDIARETGLASERVEHAAYVDEIQKAEHELVYKSLILQPFIKQEVNGRRNLCFTLENRGNVDLDLLMIETWVPSEIIDTTSIRLTWGGLLDHRGDSIDGRDYRSCQYTTVIAPGTLGIESLRPVLTPSMGRLFLRELSVGLRPGLDSQIEAVPVYFQIHARNYDTVREQVLLKEIPIRT